MGYLTPLYEGRASITAKAQARQALNALLYDGGTLFDYQPGGQVSAAGLVVDSWANAIGAAPQLPAAGAARPIWLPAATAPWTKYLYLPGIAGNFLSCPSSAANTIVGDLAIVVKVALNDWTPPTQRDLASKWKNGGATYAYEFRVSAATGLLLFQWSANGAAAVAAVQSTVAPVVADGTPLYVAVSFDVDNGALGNDVKFWTSASGAPGSWAQLGATVTTAGVTSIFAANTLFEIGSWNGGANGNATGKFQQCDLYNGIPPMFGGAASAAPVQAWTAENWTEIATNGATAASSVTGEIYTLNNTGGVPAAIIGSPIAAFDGTAHTMAMAVASVQPTYDIFVAMLPTWTAGKYIADGAAANTLGISKTTATPRISLNAGAAACENAGMTLQQFHLVTAVLNGAASSTTIDGGAAVVGNAGAGNPGGLTMGSDGAGANFGTVWYKEWIRRTSNVNLAQIQQLVRIIHSTP